MDRHEFSSEVIHDDITMTSLNSSMGTGGGQGVGGAGKGDSLKRGIRFSHFARMESSQVLEAAMLDLINIFQIKVSCQPADVTCTVKRVCDLKKKSILVWFQEASLLKGRVQLIEVPSESVLGLEGDLESCVYFIATGKLKVYRHTGDAGFNSQVSKHIANYLLKTMICPSYTDTHTLTGSTLRCLSWRVLWCPVSFDRGTFLHLHCGCHGLTPYRNH